MMTKGFRMTMPAAAQCDISPAAGAMPLGAHLALGRLRGSVTTARTWARVVLAEWGLTAQADDAEMILSELVTNAIIHTRGPVDIWLRSGGGCLAIMVGDARPDMPARTHAEADADHGRGLAIVEALSNGRWGTYPTMHGKVVWARIGP